MTEAVVADWTPEQKRDFGRRPLRFAHGLAGSALFDDAALAAMLDDCPDDELDINLFPGEDASVLGFRSGARAGASGAQIVEAVKDGRLWIQISKVQVRYPAMAEVVERCLAGMAAQRPGFRPALRTANLLVSAPHARVPYHADPVPIALFHLRGRKRIYIYPDDERHLPQDRVERIVLGTSTEDLPYRGEFDADAVVYELEPGDAATWPVHAPHRVENLGGLNVSLSIEYLWRPMRFTSGAHALNGLLRMRGIRPLPLRLTPMPVRAVMWALAGIAKRAGLTPRRLIDAEREKTFEVAAAAALAA